MRRAAAALAVAALLSPGCGGETRSASLRPVEELELERGPNGRERAPYMGIACPVPNSVRCERVGLAVWLERPAERLSASIAGRRLDLKSPGEFVGGRGTGWEGYLHPAGLAGSGPLGVAANSRGRWLGDPPVSAIVRLDAEYPDGSRATRTLRVQLAPGWG